MDEGDAHFKNAWKALISQEELLCGQTSARYRDTDLPKPQAIIIDVRGSPISFTDTIISHTFH